MAIDKEKIFKLVAQVAKPARYVGGEWNATIKPDASVRIGLCFPDLYEVGMSNNGIHILYSAVNAIPNVACERVFAVERDFEKVLRQSHTPLYTLETYTPLNELDMLGFNAACELLYTNILQVLDLGNIPFFAKDRGDSYPLIIIGGEGASNPAPLLAFADAVFAGDGEEAIIEIVKILIEKKTKRLPKDQVLTKLATIEGVLCSRDVTFTYNGGELIAIKAPEVYKRNVRKFNAYQATCPVVPSIRGVQDRVSIQLDRGCKNLCKFCHAGYWELPYRKAEPRQVADAILKTLQNTGFDDVSLHSLSVGDYSTIIELLNIIVPPLVEQGISISLPSLRVDIQTLDIIESISDLKKTSLTFAVESASDMLRYRAYKRLTVDKIMNILQVLSQKGWQRIKLYFMIGLPGCKEVDEAADIISFMKQACAINKKMQYNVTISPFVPKPHTPYQYEEQQDEIYCLEVIQKIKRNVPKSVTIKNHDVYASLIEGVLARGDSMLSDAIVAAYNQGARLDLWGEHFNFKIWDNALQQTLGNWRRYLQKRNSKEMCPWHIIRTRYDSLIHKKMNSTWDGTVFPIGYKKNALDKDSFKRAAQSFEKRYKVVATLRVQYAKKGKARFMGHIDCMEIFKRALRMAGVPVAFTQGYNKHQRLMAGPALPLGYESLCEFVDVELYEQCSPTILKALGNYFPEGFEVISAYHHTQTTISLQSIVYVRYKILFSDTMVYNTFASNLEKRANMIKKTKKGLKNMRFDDAIVQFQVHDDSVELLIPVGENSIRPDSVIADWCRLDHPLAVVTIVKTAMYYIDNGVMVEFQ
ncbi:MAG: TIGR03960 family B12-binding radical SAM protein [Spirochaetes bacterium]|nr:TIGR03960 family B12-binding radical SAM protein [Spirochaetota bacterium]